MPFRLIPRRDRKLYRLVKRGETLRLEKSQILYKKGDTSSYLYLVKGGHFRLLDPVDGTAGTGGAPPERVAGLAGPWEVVGEEALLEGSKRRFEAVAGEPAQVVALDGPGARRAIQSSQRTFEAFFRAKEAELALSRTVAESRRRGGAATRVGALLLDLAERLGREEAGKITIPMPLTHQVLADLSCSHRSTVTTLLNEWIYSGVISDEEGGLRILRPSGLRQEEA